MDSACSALKGGSPATDKATCNGNGNGQISNYEVWRAWQHLANAGMIEGSYTGVTYSTTSTLYGNPGGNMPVSKASSQAGYAFVWSGTIGSADTFVYAGEYGNTLRYGSGEGVDEGAGILLANEAWNLDTKMDDGLPGQGRFRSYKNSSRPNCATSDDPAVATYNFTTTVKGCNLLLKAGF